MTVRYLTFGLLTTAESYLILIVTSIVPAQHHPMFCRNDGLHTAPRFPVEIWERIIDWIAAVPQKDYDKRYGIPFEDLNAWETLRACALTCRAWTPRAQLHMQSDTVRIKCSPGTDGDINDFRSLLARVPTLASSIETVIAEPVADLPSTLHTMPLLLPKLLSNLKYLWFTNGPFHPVPRTVPRTWRFASLNTLRLQKVLFHSLNDLRRTIDAFGRLETLDISDPSWHPSAFTADIPSQIVYCPQSTVRLGTLWIEAQRAWLLDRRSVQFMEWLGMSGILSTLSKILLGNMMILDAKMLAAVNTVIKSAVNSAALIQLAFGPEIDFSTRE